MARWDRAENKDLLSLGRLSRSISPVLDCQYYPKASSGLVPYNNTQPELNIFKESKYPDIANKVESFMLIDRLSLS